MQKITLKDLNIEVNVIPNSNRKCKEPTCGKTIYFATNPITGRTIPIAEDEEGNWISHFKNCTKPNRF